MRRAVNVGEALAVLVRAPACPVGSGGRAGPRCRRRRGALATSQSRSRRPWRSGRARTPPPPVSPQAAVEGGALHFPQLDPRGRAADQREPTQPCRCASDWTPAVMSTSIPRSRNRPLGLGKEPRLADPGCAMVEPAPGRAWRRRPAATSREAVPRDDPAAAWWFGAGGTGHGSSSHAPRGEARGTLAVSLVGSGPAHVKPICRPVRAFDLVDRHVAGTGEELADPLRVVGVLRCPVVRRSARWSCHQASRTYSPGVRRAARRHSRRGCPASWRGVRHGAGQLGQLVVAAEEAVDLGVHQQQASAPIVAVGGYGRRFPRPPRGR